MKEKVWVEINQKNLEYNIEQFRLRVGERVKIAGVIKANAYGHGLIEVAKIIHDKVDWLAVDSVSEAIKVMGEIGETGGTSGRSGTGETGWNQILILGYTLLENLDEVVERGFHQVVSSMETLDKLKMICKEKQMPAFIHLKIETGTSRQGIWTNDLPKYLELIKANSLLKLIGVTTHFANIEDTTDHSFAKRQAENYLAAISLIEANGFNNLIRHTACSAAAILFPETHFNLIRLGISLYGMWPSAETRVSAAQQGIRIDLRPALTWKTRVAQIKILPAGSSVSYGCTEKVSAETRVAILPVGYWDGFDRRLSSVGNVLIRGTRCRVIGRVCMNMIVVDVSHLRDIQPEDEVVLLGRQESEEISAEEIAKKIGSINYEVVTRINPLIERVVE